MKLFQLLAPIAVLWSAQAMAQTPRLSLWITEAIGATNAAQCALPAMQDDMQAAALRMNVTYRIDDTDVAAWDPATATWLLRTTDIPAREHARRLADHCFLLWLDGKPAASGVALSTYSARLVSMPVLGVHVAGNTLSLRLGANHAGRLSAPVARHGIDEVLRMKPRTTKAAE